MGSVQLQRPLGLCANAISQSAVHLAAPQFLLQPGAKFRLEGAQLFGQSERHLQIAVIHAAQFAGQDTGRKLFFRAGKARHADNHRWPPQVIPCNAIISQQSSRTPRGPVLQVEFAELSLIGAREENQDRIAAAVEPNIAMIAVFDGMGGHAEGAAAAELARKILLERFAAQSHPLMDPLAFLHQALGAAHAAMVALGQRMPLEHRPRATGAVCLVQDGTAWWAHVGDSRIYHLRSGHVIRRTRDHSHVELLVQEGLISSQQAQSHPMRNYVETCLGGDPLLPEMLIGRSIRLQAGDALLVCSDGFWANLLDEDIAASLFSGAPLKTALMALAEFSVKRGGPTADNSSVAALRLQ